MIKDTITVYKCEYCGLTHIDENWVRLHEECCPKNPQNQPCSECTNCKINPFTGNTKCAYNINMDDIGGNVLCFRYNKGLPTSDLEGFNIDDNDT